MRIDVTGATCCPHQHYAATLHKSRYMPTLQYGVTSKARLSSQAQSGKPHISPQFRCYFPTTHFMLLDTASGFKPVGLQSKNLRTFIISALARYQPLIQWITAAFPPRQADGIVKLYTHLQLVQQGWPMCSPQKESIYGPRSPEWLQ